MARFFRIFRTRFVTLSRELRLRAVCVLALVAVTACIRSSGAPTVTPTGTLSVSGDAKGAARPFAVVFAAPQGDATSASEVSVVFSRPIRELSIAGDEPPPRISVTPALAGEWRWVGTTALLFVPESGRLPGATEVRVGVPADVRALDGSRLGKAFAFTFTTPRPELVSTTPHAHQRGLEPSTQIELRFNQPIDPRELERAATLQAMSAGKSKTLAFRALQPDPRDPKRLIVEPSAPLPIHSTIRLAVDASLVSKEGPLPAGIAGGIEFETYGPLGVQVSCNEDTLDQRCRPGGGLYLSFSNLVVLRDLKGAVSVEPKVPLQWDASSDGSHWTGMLELVGNFEAGKTYQITVAAGLRDRHGQSLTKRYTKTVRFGDYWPSLEIGVTGTFLEPGALRAIPVAALNTPSYELVSAHAPIDKLAELNARRDPKEKFAFVRSLTGAQHRTVRSSGAKNKTERQDVDAARLLGGAAGRGTIVVAARFDSGRDHATQHEIRVVQVTDLALSAKLSRHGSLVWVTRLSSGAPVPGATVEIWDAGKPSRSYLADSDGLVRIPEADFAPVLGRWDQAPTAILVGRFGMDVSHRNVSEFIEPWRLNVSSSLPDETSTYGMMFTDRGLYRPGDTVQVKGIARRAGPHGNEVLAGRTLDVLLHSPAHDLVARARATTTEFGTFSVSLKVPTGGELGSWAIQTEGLPEGSLSQWFEVAEYRPAEFKVKAEANRPSFVRRDRAEWKLGAEYLFGAPMARAEARYTITRTRTEFTVPNAEDFVTDSAIYYADLPQATLAGEPLQQSTIRLDSHGGAVVSQALELPEQHGPELVTADVEVMDVSRQAIAASVSTVVHPAEFYAALKLPDRYFVDAPGSYAPEVATFTPGGERLPGKKVTLELIRRRWVLARQEAGDETHAVTRPLDAVVASCSVSSETGRLVSCPLAIGESGYYIVRATAHGSKGNTATSALSFYAIGRGGASWSDHDDQSLDLALDKKTYQVGDRARVLVKSPFQDAEALVTVERGSVLHSERQKLRGPTPTITIPLTAEMAPNAFVSVHLVRGRTAPAHEGAPGSLSEPTYRIGYAELQMDTSDRRLRVAVRTNKTDYRPGEAVTVDVSVEDSRGKPRKAEVTLYAADEGVLSLIGYRTPDPHAVFTAARPLSVATLEARDALAKIALRDLTAAIGEDKGDEGGGGGADGARSDFRQSVYFNPSLVTDDRGKARATFKLAESLTTFRIMAVAVGLEDRYGSGEARVTTSTRLMARPALPRFLRTGDRVEAGVILTAKRFGPETITVRASAEGVRLAGDAAKTVRLERDGSVEVRFPFHADRAGAARFRFVAEGGGEKDSVEVERRVMTPTVLEAVALYGQTEGTSGERLGDLAALRRDVGRLDVSLASTALVGLDGGLEQLVEYPYGCTEQLASRLLPLLPLASLAKDFAFPLPTNVDALADRTVGEILQRQQGDGGFGMWPDSPESAPWASAYALWVLHEASLRKAHVPKTVFTRGVDYLRRQLNEPDADPISFATAPFVADVLAELGRPDTGHMSRLFEKRDRLPVFSRALLLHAYAIRKLDRKVIATLAGEIENELVLGPNTAAVRENVGDEYAVIMDSEARSSAIVLRALLATDREHPLASKIARGLLEARRGGTWRSTQETAFALLALDAYRKAQEDRVPDFSARAWLGDTELTEARFAGRSAKAHRATLPMGKLGAAPEVLAFQKEGSGTLFYEARLSYARRDLPREPIDRGFFVQKSLRPVQPEALAEALRAGPHAGSETFAAGDLVLADVVVVASGPRDFVVVEDPLPPGLEAVDAQLATTARWLDIGDTSAEPADCADCYERGDDRLPGAAAYGESWFRRELRDDRVLHFVDHMAAGMYRYRYLARATTIGKFVQPPTRVEQMYAPEVFGRTRATTLEVR